MQRRCVHCCGPTLTDCNMLAVCVNKLDANLLIIRLPLQGVLCGRNQASGFCSAFIKLPKGKEIKRVYQPPCFCLVFHPFSCRQLAVIYLLVSLSH